MRGNACQRVILRRGVAISSETQASYSLRSEPLVGEVSSVAFIHCNLIHGSANSVSPWRRGIIYLNYNNCNAVGNACTDHSRAWYQGNRDTAPLDPVEDTALLALIFYQAPSA